LLKKRLAKYGLTVYCVHKIDFAHGDNEVAQMKRKTIQVWETTKDKLELGRIDYINKTGVVISLADYIDRLSDKKPNLPKKK